MRQRDMKPLSDKQMDLLARLNNGAYLRATQGYKRGWAIAGKPVSGTTIWSLEKRGLLYVIEILSSTMLVKLSSEGRYTTRHGEQRSTRPQKPKTFVEGRGWRYLCGAKTRRGTACQRVSEARNGRCRLHGGFSTGPRTPEGRQRVAEAVSIRMRQTWAARKANMDSPVAERIGAG